MFVANSDPYGKNEMLLNDDYLENDPLNKRKQSTNALNKKSREALAEDLNNNTFNNSVLCKESKATKEKD